MNMPRMSCKQRKQSQNLSSGAMRSPIKSGRKHARVQHCDAIKINTGHYIMVS